MPPTPAHRSSHWTTTRVRQDPSSPSWARHRLRDALATAGVARSSVADAELVLGELLSNAILHGAPDAAGTVEVSWLLDHGRLVMSVHDDGHVGDLVAGPLTDDGVSGRGLAIVDGLCSHWHVEHDGGTRVVAQLALATA